MKTLKWTKTIAVLVLVASTGIVAGQQAVSQFTSGKARTAEIRYNAAVKNLESEYFRKLTELKRTYATDLRDAKDAATKAGNLDEAVKIRDTIVVLDTETTDLPKKPEKQPEPERKVANVQPPRTNQRGAEPWKYKLPPEALQGENLRQGLIGTKWEYAECGSLVFNAGGTVTKEYEVEIEDVKGPWFWMPIDQSRAMLYCPRPDGVKIMAFGRSTSTSSTIYRFQSMWTGTS